MMQDRSDAEQRFPYLQALQSLVREKRYSVRSHAVDHMFKEGFGERHIVEAILTGRSWRYIQKNVAV